MTTMLQLVLLFDQSKSETSNTPHVKFCADMVAKIMFYFLSSLAVLFGVGLHVVMKKLICFVNEYWYLDFLSFPLIN